jgi:hypothetical protein
MSDVLSSSSLEAGWLASEIMIRRQASHALNR